MIKPGEPWGSPTDERADVVVTGDDAALAAAVPVDLMSVLLVCFLPEGSDFARVVGVATITDDAAPRGFALPVDAIETDRGIAMNVVTIGRAPGSLRAWHRSRHVTITVDGRAVHDGRATTVVIANGQFSGTADLAPRGHPGDGRLEVQVYTLTAAERGAMRRRLPTGTHLPHPRIVATSGRTIVVRVPGSGLPATLDGRPVGRVQGLDLAVRHPALRLLV